MGKQKTWTGRLTESEQQYISIIQCNRSVLPNRSTAETGVLMKVIQVQRRSCVHAVEGWQFTFTVHFFRAENKLANEQEAYY